MQNNSNSDFIFDAPSTSFYSPNPSGLPKPPLKNTSNDPFGFSGPAPVTKSDPTMDLFSVLNSGSQFQQNNLFSVQETNTLNNQFTGMTITRPTEFPKASTNYSTGMSTGFVQSPPLFGQSQSYGANTNQNSGLDFFGIGSQAPASNVATRGTSFASQSSSSSSFTTKPTTSYGYQPQTSPKKDEFGVFQSAEKDPWVMGQGIVNLSNLKKKEDTKKPQPKMNFYNKQAEPSSFAGFGGAPSFATPAYAPPSSDIFGAPVSSTQNQYGYGSFGGSGYGQTNTQSNPLADFGGLFSTGQPKQNTNTFGGTGRDNNSLFD